MKGDTAVDAPRLFAATEAVLEWVHRKGGTVFGDELLVCAGRSMAPNVSGREFTQDELTEAVKFLIRMGFLTTSDPEEDES